MNNFLEEKEKLLNSIENNTPNHWKEYYKDVPIDCIFDDLVLDVNEIKRLTRENQQLKEFIKWLEEEIKEIIRDAGYHRRIGEDILEKYKEIVGSDK